MACPCGSEKTYNDCCSPVLEGQVKPTTPEQLMRARYTAYTQCDIDFIEKTHDPRTRDEFDMEANKDWAKNAEWKGLEVIRTEVDEEKGRGIVEFKAQYSLGENLETHHELSEFNRRNGLWYFSDGKNPTLQTMRRGEEKVGRNDPCLCGSGKKYKKCCGVN